MGVGCSGWGPGSVTSIAKGLLLSLACCVPMNLYTDGRCNETKPSLAVTPIESGKFYKMAVAAPTAQRVRFYLQRTLAGVKEKRQIKQDTDPSDGFAVIWRPRGLYGSIQIYAIAEYDDGRKVETEHLDMLVCKTPSKKKRG